MNNQHKGAEMQLLGQFETSYKVVGAAAALRLPFISCGLARDLRRTDDPSIDNSPLPAKSGCGDAIVPPASLTSIADARTIGFYLKAILGQPLVKKAVTVQPVTVTGVTIHYAGSATAAGNGTLGWLISGTTLSWTPPSGTIGTLINVGAGGRFTIPGGGANTEIVVDVVAGSLPVGNVSEATIAVHATLKAHVFPWTLDDRSSCLLEFGHMKTGQTEFYRYLGGIFSKMSHDITARDQNITLTAFAAEERSADTTPAVTTVFDAAPTSYDRLRFCGSGGTLNNGLNSAFGVVTEASLELDNQATGLEVADGAEGYGHADNGEVMAGGKVKLVFRGQSAGNIWNLARTSTSSRMHLTSKVPSGADTFRLDHDFPSVEFMPDPIEKAGKTGLFVTASWRAHRNIAGTLPMTVLVNDVPSY